MKTSIKGVGNVLPRNKNLYSNYNTDSEIDSSSPADLENEAELDIEPEEGEEENTPLTEENSSTDDSDEDTEPRKPAVAEKDASSSIDITQATSKRQSVIPSRPTGQAAMVEMPSGQARCDGLLKRINVLRGYALESGPYIRSQADAIRALVTQYSDAELAWILCYTRYLSESYKAMKPDYSYAQILLEVAPDALAAATADVRPVLMEHFAAMEQKSPVTSQPVASSRQPQAAPASNNPYSVAAQLERQRQAELAHGRKS